MRCPTCKWEMERLENYDIVCQNPNCHFDGDVLLHGVYHERDEYIDVLEKSLENVFHVSPTQKRTPFEIFNARMERDRNEK